MPPKKNSIDKTKTNEKKEKKEKIEKIVGGSGSRDRGRDRGRDRDGDRNRNRYINRDGDRDRDRGIHRNRDEYRYRDGDRDRDEYRRSRSDKDRDEYRRRSRSDRDRDRNRDNINNLERRREEEKRSRSRYRDRDREEEKRSRSRYRDGDRDRNREEEKRRENSEIYRIALLTEHFERQEQMKRIKTYIFEINKKLNEGSLINSDKDVSQCAAKDKIAIEQKSKACITNNHIQQNQACLNPFPLLNSDIKALHPIYKSFYDQIIKKSERYIGKPILKISGNYKNNLICPEYQICLGRNWYSFSRGRNNGYLYIYIEDKYKKNSDDCIILGEHITIGNKSEDSRLLSKTVDIHFTLYNYEMSKAIYTVICKLDIEELFYIINDITKTRDQKIESIGNLRNCENNTTLKEKITEYNDTNTNKYMKIIYYMFKKGLYDLIK